MHRILNSPCQANNKTYNISHKCNNIIIILGVCACVFVACDRRLWSSHPREFRMIRRGRYIICIYVRGGFAVRLCSARPFETGKMNVVFVFIYICFLFFFHVHSKMSARFVKYACMRVILLPTLVRIMTMQLAQ